MDEGMRSQLWKTKQVDVSQFYICLGKKKHHNFTELRQRRAQPNEK